MTDLLAQIVIGVIVGLFAALPTALLLIAYLSGNPFRGAPTWLTSGESGEGDNMLTRFAGLWPLLCAAAAVILGAWLLAGPVLGWQTPLAELAAGAYVALGVFAVWLGRWQARKR